MLDLSILRGILLLIFLSYFSYRDLKTREIDDWLVYVVFLLGLALGVVQVKQMLISLGISLLLAGLLYLGGLFALGDFWIMLIISVYDPTNLMGLPVSVWSLMGASILGAAYGIYLMVKKNPREWINLWVRSVAVSLGFGFNVVVGFLASFIVKDRPILSLVFLPFIVLTGRVWRTLGIMGLFLITATVFEALRKREIFVISKEPEEGDIPAEVIDKDGKRYKLDWRTSLEIKKGRIRPIHSLGADGLTKEDIKKLREMGIEEMKVRTSIPFIPFITASWVFLWMLEILF